MTLWKLMEKKVGRVRVVVKGEVFWLKVEMARRVHHLALRSGEMCIVAEVQ